MARRRRTGEGGFTLIEVLVALGMFGLLMVMLTGGIRIVTRGYDGGTRQAERWAQLPIAQDFVREQVANARLSVPVRGGDEPLAFRGARDHVVFVGLLPAHFAVGGLQTIFIGLWQDRDGRSLVMRWIPYRGGPIEGDALQPPPGTAPDMAVLLDHVAAVEFSYFGAAERTLAPSWQETWQRADSGPSLLRMRLAFEDGHAPPALVAALRAAPPPPR